MSFSKILIVDDDPEIRFQLSRWLREDKIDTDEAESGEQALKKIKHQTYSVILLDLVLPNGIDGFEVLKHIHHDYPDSCVIVLTAYKDDDKMRRALKEGATDFIDKLKDLNTLLPRIDIAIQKFNIERESQYQLEEQFQRYRFDNIIGNSIKMLEVFDLVKTVASEDTTVLITGESGTGKDLIAKALHLNSQRATKPFIVADCGAMTETIVESQLFGHEKGAFTGAIKRKKGFLERAHEGSIFINEIGEMSPNLQIKLLRFLEEKTYERVGGEESLKADVRVIAATNKNLEKERVEKKFREDLFFRLNKFPIHLPPLRERRDDIPLLIDYFISHFNKNRQKKIKKISLEALNILMRYSFPGNVRELENIIERAVLLEKSDEISAKSLPCNLGNGNFTLNQNFSDLSFSDAKEKFERLYVMDALAKTGGNISQAAKVAEIDRANFKQKMKKYGIKKNGSSKF
jgi:DNA-binding NtrC family response regulator